MKFNQLTFIALLILNSLQLNCFGQIKFHNLNKLNSISKSKNPIKSPSNNASAQIEINKFISLLVTNIENVSNNNQNQLNNFQIISDTQLRTEDIFIAEGNVVIQNGSTILVANKFEYNYKSKKVSLLGNIKFNTEEQFFEASEFKFDLKK